MTAKLAGIALAAFVAICALYLSHPEPQQPAHRDAFSDWSTVSSNGRAIRARRNESLVARIRSDMRDLDRLPLPPVFPQLAGTKEWE